MKIRIKINLRQYPNVTKDFRSHYFDRMREVAPGWSSYWVYLPIVCKLVSSDNSFVFLCLTCKTLMLNVPWDIIIKMDQLNRLIIGIIWLFIWRNSTVWEGVAITAYPYEGVHTIILLLLWFFTLFKVFVGMKIVRLLWWELVLIKVGVSIKAKKVVRSQNA